MSVISAAELLHGVLACLAPARCAGCDGPCSDEAVCAAFCAGCEPLLDEPPESLRPPAAAAAAYSYGGPLADAIAKLKYGRRTELAPLLGQLLAHAALPYAGLVDSVIPMPLFPRKLRARGFNQSALLGAYVARSLGVPLWTDRLHRVRDTAEQAGLTRHARAANVRAAFVAQPLCERVLLLDDVRTTGATLASGAEALCAAGAPAVITLALAAAAR